MSLNFTFIPSWIINDILVYIVAVMMVIYIVKKEERPVTALLEFMSFVFLYAAVFENLAGVAHFYGYGRSIIMIFNVPLSVPVFEYLIIYSGMKIIETMKVPGWTKPVIAGFIAIIADFSMDPVAVKMIHKTLEGTIGRWTWYPNPGVPLIYGEPVHNFTGWMYLTAYCLMFFMIGRILHKKSNYSKAVGYAYPVISAIAALLVMFSPISNFLIVNANLGNSGEWIPFIFAMIVSVFILAVLWRGRMTGSLSVKEDFPVFLSLLGFPIVNIFFCILGGYWQILWLVILAGIAAWILIGGIYVLGKRHTAGEKRLNNQKTAVNILR